MRHSCPWSGCRRAIRPHFFMCREHWFALPKSMREEILRVGRTGQELGNDSSREYVAATRAALDWARDRVIRARAQA